MSATFVIAFWAILAGIYGLFWLLFLVLLVIGLRRKSRPLLLLGGIPLVLSSVFAVFCLGAVTYGFYYNSKPANIYANAFGFPPSADVKNIRSSYYYFADYGSTYLTFTAAPSTIKRLTAKGWTRLKGQSLTEALSFYDGSPPTSPDDDTPAWWKPIATDTTQLYSASHRVGDFSTAEDETLLYNTVTHEAYYSYTGID